MLPFCNVDLVRWLANIFCSLPIVSLPQASFKGGQLTLMFDGSVTANVSEGKPLQVTSLDFFVLVHPLHPLQPCMSSRTLSAVDPQQTLEVSLGCGKV